MGDTTAGTPVAPLVSQAVRGPVISGILAALHPDVELEVRSQVRGPVATVDLDSLSSEILATATATPMPEPTTHFAETCPECDHQWEQRLSDGTPLGYTNLVGIYDRDRDRTAEWMCPNCLHRWDRSDRTVLREGP